MMKLKQILNEQSVLSGAVTNLYNRYRITDPKIINLLETYAQLYVKILEENNKDVELIPYSTIPFLLKRLSSNMTLDDYNLVKKHKELLKDRALEITRTKE